MKHFRSGHLLPKANDGNHEPDCTKNEKWWFSRDEFKVVVSKHSHIGCCCKTSWNTLLWAVLARHSCKTLNLWDAFAAHSHGILCGMIILWDILVGHFCVTLSHDTFMGLFWKKHILNISEFAAQWSWKTRYWDILTTQSCGKSLHTDQRKFHRETPSYGKWAFSLCVQLASSLRDHQVTLYIRFSLAQYDCVQMAPSLRNH